MAVTGFLYAAYLDHLAQKRIDLDSDTFKVMLVTSAYTPNQDTHNYRDDVTNEITGTGYTAGGATLASVTWTYDSGTDTWKFDAADTSWTSATFTAAAAVIYDASPGTAGTDPLVGFIDFDGDKSPSAGTFALNWHADGILTHTV